MRTTRVTAHTKGINLKKAELYLKHEEQTLRTEENKKFSSLNIDKINKIENDIKLVKKEIIQIEKNPNLTMTQAKKLLNQKRQEHKNHIKKFKKEVKHILKSKHKIGTALHDAKKGISHFIKTEEEHAKHWWQTRGKQETKQAAKKTAKWLGHEAHKSGVFVKEKAKKGFHTIGNWLSKKWEEHKAKKAIKQETGQNLETY